MEFGVLSGLHATSVKPYTDLIEGLRKQGIHSDVHLPQIAVLGEQGSGKSSVLDALRDSSANPQRRSSIDVGSRDSSATPQRRGSLEAAPAARDSSLNPQRKSSTSSIDYAVDDFGWVECSVADVARARISRSSPSKIKPNGCSSVARTPVACIAPLAPTCFRAVALFS